MEGLQRIDEIPQRRTRQEEQILYDEPVYRLVNRLASRSDMQEIDGWARSFYTREGHLAAIMQYQKPLLPEPQSPQWTEAKRQTRHEIANLFPPVMSLDFEKDLDRVPFESSSAAGYGYDGKKSEGNNFKRAKGIANALVRTYVENIDAMGPVYADQHLADSSTPDVAFTRTQLAKLPSIKVRNVFGEAFHYILLEGLSASPLLEAFKRADTFYCTGKDPTTYVPTFLQAQDRTRGWIIALDWSKFDASVQTWEIEHAFQCLEQLLTFPNRHSRAAFDASKATFIKRKLASPDGVLYMRTGGIPSGSYFTNLIGSIINYTRIRFIFNKMDYPILGCKVQGDDSVIKTSMIFKPDMTALADMVTEFGWQLSPSKCMVSLLSEDITFLGRSQQQLFNIRERLKVLRLMCFPEYEVDDPKISTARVRMIARDAGFRDPLYNSILYGMVKLYGEAETVPRHLQTYVDLDDWQDVNM